MKICSLGSGSAGNCLAVFNDNGGLLIDVGLNRKQTLARMARSEIKPEWFQAILLSHAHHDHHAGLKLLALQLGTPVYCTQETADAVPFLCDHPGLYRPIGVRDVFEVAGFTVQARPTIHNAAGACTFMVKEQGTHAKLAMLFETGRLTRELIDAADGATVVAVEANHDRRMLAANEKLPLGIMERVAVTHLSNVAAGKYLETLNGETRLVLALHRSLNNNDPDLCRATLQAALDKAGSKAELVLAEQGEPSPVFKL